MGDGWELVVGSLVTSVPLLAGQQLLLQEPRIVSPTKASLKPTTQSNQIHSFFGAFSRRAFELRVVFEWL